MISLTLEWDSYDMPDVLSLFGLDAEMEGVADSTL